MLSSVFNKLDAWIIKTNREALHSGFLSIPKTEIHVIGQTALLEAKLHFFITATMDVDTKNQLEHRVRQKLSELLDEVGKKLDPVGHEAWMPEETEYRKIFDGKNIQGFIAEPVYVILSKAKKAPEKNKNLIVAYLASSDLDQRIFALAKKYQVQLEDFV